MGGAREEAWSTREEFKDPLFCGSTGRASGVAGEPDEGVSSAMEKVRAAHAHLHRQARAVGGGAGGQRSEVSKRCTTATEVQVGCVSMTDAEVSRVNCPTSTAKR